MEEKRQKASKGGIPIRVGVYAPISPICLYIEIIWSLHSSIATEDKAMPILHPQSVIL